VLKERGELLGVLCWPLALPEHLAQHVLPNLCRLVGQRGVLRPDARDLPAQQVEVLPVLDASSAGQEYAYTMPFPREKPERI